MAVNIHALGDGCRPSARLSSAISTCKGARVSALLLSCTKISQMLIDWLSNNIYVLMYLIIPLVSLYISFSC